MIGAGTRRDRPGPQGRSLPSWGSQPALGTRSAVVAAARKLRHPPGRRAEGRFLVEGAQAVGAALDAGRLVELFVGAGARVRFAGLLERAGVPVHVLTDAAVAALSETVTPQGLVGVAGLPLHRLDDLARPRLVAVCVETNDPGNAGTIIRTADAAGADAVVFAGAGVDPFGGKCVRSSAGSVFHLPVIVSPDREGLLAQLRGLGLRVLATSGDAHADLYGAETGTALAGPTAWLFGNEAHGLSRDWKVSADTVVRVPVYGQAESLNVAVTCALCLYASARAQRMARSGGPSAGGGGRL